MVQIVNAHPRQPIAHRLLQKPYVPKPQNEDAKVVLLAGPPGTGKVRELGLLSSYSSMASLSLCILFLCVALLTSQIIPLVLHRWTCLSLCPLFVCMSTQKVSHSDCTENRPFFRCSLFVCLSQVLTTWIHIETCRHIHRGKLHFFPRRSICDSSSCKRARERPTTHAHF